MFPAVADDASASRQVLSPLHTACLYGELATVKLLVESRPAWGWIDGADLQGRRPIHMVLSPRSAPNTFSCLTYLLAHGANVNVATNTGATPLHLAATEGLLDCTEVLLQAGADVSFKDSMGLTPLELARVWCHRKVARCLKNGVWQHEKKMEMRERKLVQALYSELVDMVKLNHIDKKTLIAENMAEWAKKKGLPLVKDFSPRVLMSQYHTQCLVPLQDRSHPKRAEQRAEDPLEDGSTGRPPASPSRPWTIFTGFQSEESLKEPDLRDKVTVWRDDGSGQLQYTTVWDGTHRPAPDVSLDILERVLFPRDFPSRIAPPCYFESKDIVEVKQRGKPQGRSTSPWTEVAMHLAEVLEPGHY